LDADKFFFNIFQVDADAGIVDDDGWMLAYHKTEP
jgi:hypothetical protein